MRLGDDRGVAPSRATTSFASEAAAFDRSSLGLDHGRQVSGTSDTSGRTLSLRKLESMGKAGHTSANMSTVVRPRLICIGMPLLQLQADVPQKVIQRLNFPPNSHVQVDDTHMPLLRALLGVGNETDTVGRDIPPSTDDCAGGSAAVVARCARALSLANELGRLVNESEQDLEIFLLGGVGKDEICARVKELLQKDDIGVLFSETEAHLTGWRAMLRMARGRDRDGGLGQPPGVDASDFDGMVQRALQVCVATYTGAAREYQLDHLRFKVWDEVDKLSVAYLDAQFLTVSHDSGRIVAERCAKLGRTFCLGLSSRYLCAYFSDRILSILPYTDYVFGNESEYLELGMHCGQKEESLGSLEDAVSWLAKLPRADGNQTLRRKVIVTAGAKPVVVATTWQGHGVKVLRYPVPPVRAGRIQSKEGAGDAFAGGFIYGLILEADLDGCVQMALHAANQSVMRMKQAFDFKDRPEVARAYPIECG